MTTVSVRLQGMRTCAQCAQWARRACQLRAGDGSCVETTTMLLSPDTSAASAAWQDSQWCKAVCLAAAVQLLTQSTGFVGMGCFVSYQRTSPSATRPCSSTFIRRVGVATNTSRGAVSARDCVFSLQCSNRQDTQRPAQLPTRTCRPT